MRGPHQLAADAQVGRVRRQVPVGELADEPEQRLAQLGVIRRRLPHRAQDGGRLPLEGVRAVRVERIGQQQGQQHGARGGERAPRPPEMERGRMPVADRLLPRRVPGHLGDRKVDLGQPPARPGNHVRIGRSTDGLIANQTDNLTNREIDGI